MPGFWDYYYDKSKKKKKKEAQLDIENHIWLSNAAAMSKRLQHIQYFFVKVTLTHARILEKQKESDK